jgi:aldose 1-epimerase
VTGRGVPSGAQFEIRSGRHRATLVEVGGGIRTYTYDGRPVLDGYPPEEMCSGARGTPLIPWPNRLADGAYTFDGTDHQVALTEPEAHNAIHGFLRWRNWTPLETEPDRVVLGTVLHPLPGYPFTLGVTVDYRLRSGPSDDSRTSDPGRTGLTVATTATNMGAQRCPYGTGHHPYLRAGTEYIDDAELQMRAERWLPTDQRGLPTGTIPVAGSPYDFRGARHIGDTIIDYAFTDLARDSDGLAWVVLTGPQQQRTRLWADEHYRFIELYTGDTQPPDKRRRGLGVEPMTCAPNGLRSGNGLLTLEPGQSITTRWGVEPDQPAGPHPHEIVRERQPS